MNRAGSMARMSTVASDRVIQELKAKTGQIMHRRVTELKIESKWLLSEKSHDGCSAESAGIRLAYYRQQEKEFENEST